MGRYILAIDQGTTSSRALIVDRSGAVAGAGQRPFTQHFPAPGEVEHDPEEIWSSIREAITEALQAATLAPGDIAAIGITNQRETVVAWHAKTGAPAGRAIVWQDRRTAAACETLRAAGYEALIHEKTGLTVDPYFSGTKMSWMLEHTPGLRLGAERGEALFGTIGSWLIWKLTGGRAHLTDTTNASRTLLLNLKTGRWDQQLCDLLNVPMASLPEVLPSAAKFGETSEAVFGAEVPIFAVAGDQQAALFGQGCVRPGQAKNTYGTGCFLLAHDGVSAHLSGNRLLTTHAVSLDGEPRFAIEGSVFVAGSLVQWLRDELGIVQTSAEVEALALTVPDTAGVTIVPAFTGLGAPHWDASARGAILGLTRGSGRGHIARAALEAIALSSAELALAIEADLGAPLRELRVDGGASRNDLLMQMQADFSGLRVIRPKNIETTAMGAAYLAGIGAGFWAGEEETVSLQAVDRVFEPSIGGAEREERLQAWRGSVARVLTEARR